MPGCGRAPPGRAAGRGIEPPSLLVKGLLPGRGAAGRGGAGSLLVNGLLPGRGPAGRWGASGARAAAGAAGGSGASTGSTGCSGPDGATAGATAGVTAGAAGASTTGGTSAVAAAVFFAGAFLVVFFAVFLAAAPSLPSPADWAGKTSFNLRTTGGSTVDDADLTNSPMSWSLARTTLLSTPSSFASSYTRTFATALLSCGPGSTSTGGSDR
jgi:hypothetical protein